MIRFPFLALGIMLIISACDQDQTPVPSETSNCDSNIAYYKNDILPILSSSCSQSGCHDAASHKEGYDFTTYTSAKRAANGELVEVIKKNGEERMPPAGYPQLSSAQIGLIEKWVAQGALNNACTADSSSCVTTGISFTGQVMPIITTNCIGCHSSGNASGGVSLSAYSDVKIVAANGKLYNSVAKNGQAHPMPPSYKLTSCDISQIKAWVDAGYPNN
jgi:mono/diheme cytochrome c family protein